MAFKDRVDAGRKLATILLDYQDSVVYGLPRGGVVVAAEIARKLKVPLDLIIVRKIGHPFNPEYAICAVAEDGHAICNAEELTHIDQTWFAKEKEHEQQEAKRRRKVYLGDRNPVDAKGKIAILVDDGVATGLTFLTAIQELQHKNPKKIIAALPVSPHETAQQIKQQVDALICLDIPTSYLGAVGAYYQNFDQVEDEEVIEAITSLRGFTP